MVEISMPHGKVTVVDEADFERLSQWNWHVDGKGYALRTGRKSDGPLCRKGIFMHRQIMGVTDPSVEVDHHDHNTLNNQRSNLRLCSSLGNHANASLQVNTTSGYKGVSFDKRKKRWQSRLKVKGEQIFLGYFSTKEQAAVTYNRAAIKHFGAFACLNEIQL
jgi:type V secretory pathway adhesin AidA